VLITLLNFRNLVNMLQADCGKGFLSSPGRTLFDTSNLLEQVRHRRSLGNEAERAVWLDDDGTGDRHARIDVNCPSVELFAKVHRLHALGTESRPDWG